MSEFFGGYDIGRQLGKGAFAKVYSCTKNGNEKMAIKVANYTAERFKVQSMREKKILDLMREKKNGENYIIRCLDSFLDSRGCITFVFELGDRNLYDIMRSSGFKPFEYSEVKKISFQILTGLQFLSEHKIVHSDMKPENLIRMHNGDVKIIDFGSSFFEHNRIHTYIQSRYYRAPEIILGLGYGRPIDMWSFGCIIYELLTARPLFPGKNETEILTLMVNRLELPPTEVLKKCSRPTDFFIFGKLRNERDNKGRLRRAGANPIHVSDPLLTSNTLSFLEKLLTWEVDKRLTASQALKEPFVISEE